MMMARFPAFMASWGSPLPTVVDTIWRAFARGHCPTAFPRPTAARLARPLRSPATTPRQDGLRRAEHRSRRLGRHAPTAMARTPSMSVCQGDVRNTPIETLELKAPVLVLERSLWPDSGGAGRFRGGLGRSDHDPVPRRWALERRPARASLPAARRGV